MAYTIWKTILKVAATQDIEVPADAVMLTAREQFGDICIWFKCDPENNLVKRQIAICGTGHPTPEGGRYIGTCFLTGGSLVLHVFEWVPR